MELQDIITLLISFASGGGLVTLLTLRQSKEGKQIDNAASLVREYRDLLEHYQTEAKNAQDEVNELRKEMAELKVQYATLQAKVASQDTVLRSALVSRCEIYNCKKRRPPIKPEDLNELVGLNKKTEDEENNKSDN